MELNERTIAGVTILDLKGRLTFTSGEAFTVSRHKAVSLKLLNPTKRTRHLLEITGLARIVDCFDSEAAALGSWLRAEDTHVASSLSEA